MKKILITGGAGVIGRQLVPMLFDKGYKCIVIDKANIVDELIGKCHYIQDDVNDISPNDISDIGYEAIIHLAASFERTTETKDFYITNFKDNLTCSHSAINFLNKNVTKYINASSYLVYNDDLYCDIDERPYFLNEASEISPRNLTGNAKLMHECEVNHCKQYFPNTNFTNLRIFRGIGLGSRCIISRWINAAIKGEEISLYNAEGIFDYIYCKDTALGIICALESDNSGTFNLASGRPRKVIEIVNHLKTHFPKLEIKDNGTMGRVEFSAANTDKISKNTSFKPKYSLEQAIDEMVFYEKNKYSSDVAFENKHKILITSAGNKSALLDSAIKSLRFQNVEIIAADFNDDCFVNNLGYHFLKLEKTTIENESNIINLLKEKKISIILPTRDRELAFWSKLRPRLLEDGINIIISDQETIGICDDKLKFYHFCKDNDLPTIKTFSAPTDGKQIAKELNGAGSKGIYIFDCKSDADDAKLSGMVYQEFIEGIEYSFDSLSDMSGNFISGISRIREVTINGESKITTHVKNKEYEDNCRLLLNSLGIKGPAVTQFFVTSNGEFKFIEVNARVGGAYTSTILSGLRFWEFLINNELKDSWKFQRPLIGRYQRVQKDSYDNNI